MRTQKTQHQNVSIVARKNYIYIYIEREREYITFFWEENNKYRIKDNEKNIQNKRYSCKHQIIRTILCNRITLVANPCDA